ncbi:PapB/FocB family fimbrial expression transcriptional regulator [Citrobacter arsenatis]|uniref:PapB/FocB family fimbrial expression transcriptional regulator n=1 Tax=Citrobacter arsenatis TaxID=2546350 RepID=UPI003AB91E3A
MQLCPGSFTSQQFDLFIALSSIRSQSAISALKDYFVCGYNRRTVCATHGISQGYLSLKIKECRLLSKKLHAFLSAISLTHQDKEIH